MQAIKFGGTFDQLFLWIFLWNCHRRSPSTSSIPWCKKSQKWPKTQIKGGPALNTWTSDHSLWLILLFEKEQSSVKGLKVIVQPEAPCTTSLVNTQCTCCSSLGWVVRFHSIFPLNLLCCLHSLTASVCFAPPCDIGSAWDRIVHLSLHRHTSTKFYGRGCFRPVRCYIARWVASVCSNQSSLGANIFSKHIIAFLRIVQVRSHITVLQLSKVSSRNQKKRPARQLAGNAHWNILMIFRTTPIRNFWSLKATVVPVHLVALVWRQGRGPQHTASEPAAESVRFFPPLNLRLHKPCLFCWLFLCLSLTFLLCL